MSVTDRRPPEDEDVPEETLTLRGRELPVGHAGVPEAPHGRPDSPVRLAFAFGLIAVAIVGALALGLALGPRAAGGGESDGREFLGGFNGLGALWIMVGTLFLGWALTGRWALRPFGQLLRRNRVGIHTWTSMAALAMALVHTVGLLATEDTRGWLSGAASTLLLGALFVTGWWRTFWVKRWGLRTWRWVHWELAVGAIALGFEHWLLIEHAKEAARHAAGA